MAATKRFSLEWRFHALLQLAVLVWVTAASFVHYPLHHLGAYVQYAAHLLALQVTVFGFLYMLCWNRWIFYVTFPPLFTLFAAAGYWVYAQDIALSHAVVRATLETTADVAADVISIPFALYVLSALAASVALCVMRSRFKPKPSWLTIAAIAGIALFYIAEAYKYGVFRRRLPYNLVEAFQDYRSTDRITFKPVPNGLRSKNNVNVVLVLGETVRADHMQLNGYARATNPKLSRRTNVISFPNAYTPKTYTAESLQQLFTDAPFDAQDQPYYSLIQVLDAAAIATDWIGNQTPEKSYEAFIAQCDRHEILDPFHSELSFRKAYDQALLVPFSKSFSAAQKQFTVLHMMGSHWWYETRYPAAFRKFNPVVTSKNIGSNSTQEMVNAYDNTIVYLDTFLDDLIGKIENSSHPVLVIYLSDHGELLGENGQWLHAQPGKAVSNPALLVSYSKGFAKQYPEWLAKIRERRTQKTPLEFLFPTVIDAFGIDGFSTDRSLLR